MKAFLKKSCSIFAAVAVFMAFLLAGAKASAEAGDEKYYTVGSMEVREISQPSFRSMEEPICDEGDKPAGKKPPFRPNFDEINLNEIVNLGQKIWTIVEKNKPVVNIKIQKADALPTGVKEWGDLECWQVPESRLFEVSYKNLYNMTVVKIVLRVNYTYGGRISGQGRYLSQVTVLPAQVDVIWGYTLNADVKVVNVTNAGTKAYPIAGIQLDVNWNIKTVFKYSESTESFYVRGDGLYKHLN